MLEDPILKEIRRIRQEHSTRFDHDLDRIYQDLKRRQEESGRRYVCYPPRRPRDLGGAVRPESKSKPGDASSGEKTS